MFVKSTLLASFLFAGTAGSAFGRTLGLFCLVVGSKEISLAINNTSADPNFDTDTTVSGMGFSGSVVDVGSQGMERSSSFLEMFGSCHFSAAETT